MQLIVFQGGAGDAAVCRRRLEEVFRWQLGSWAGQLRRVDLCVEPWETCGPGFNCNINATLRDWGNLAVHALGPDPECATRSAARQLVGHLRRRAAANDPRPLGRAFRPDAKGVF